MTNTSKRLLGFAMATILVAQAMLFPLLSSHDDFGEATKSDELSLQGTFLTDAGDTTLVIFQSERLLISIPKSLSEGSSFVANAFTNYFFYISTRLAMVYQRCHLVLLVFGIREIKFPTHFFW